MKKAIFTYEYVSSLEELRYIILDNCEGGHIQQVAYSTYHDALTQICFTCKTIRSNIKLRDVKKIYKL